MLRKHAEKLLRSAIAHHQSGNLAEAELSCRELLHFNPNNASACFFLGNILKDKKSFEEAEKCYRRAIELNPDYAEAYINLGIILNVMGRREEAEASFRKTVEIKPDFVDAHIDLGIILNEMGRRTEAETSFLRALHLDPDSAVAYCNLGTLYDVMGRMEDAEANLRKALELKPDYVDAYNNLGNILKDIGRTDEAEANYRRALELDPDCSDAYYNLGLLLLSVGRYSEGWLYYEFRIDPRRRIIRHSHFNFPRWKGELLEGKTILVYPEQGLGDYIQFARYLPMLKKMGVTRLTLVCQPALKPLLETVSGADAVVTELPEESQDYWIPPMSLPLCFSTTLDTIPTNISYLHALTERMKKWSLSTCEFKVGLVWKGNKDHGNDRNRSLSGISVLAPLWTVPGITFYSLQKGQGEDEAKNPPAGQPLIHLGSDIEDFADTAAIVAQLDLVICVDTAIAHLAGALGKPCWVLLPAIKFDWRWLRDREDSPWYPSLRLFRQKEIGKWDAVVQHLCCSLEDEVARRVL